MADLIRLALGLILQQVLIFDQQSADIVRLFVLQE